MEGPAGAPSENVDVPAGTLELNGVRGARLSDDRRRDVKRSTEEGEEVEVRLDCPTERSPQNGNGQTWQKAGCGRDEKESPVEEAVRYPSSSGARAAAKPDDKAGDPEGALREESASPEKLGGRDTARAEDATPGESLMLDRRWYIHRRKRLNASLLGVPDGGSEDPGT